MQILQLVFTVVVMGASVESFFTQLMVIFKLKNWLNPSVELFSGINSFVIIFIGLLLVLKKKYIFLLPVLFFGFSITSLCIYIKSGSPGYSTNTFTIFCAPGSLLFLFFSGITLMFGGEKIILCRKIAICLTTFGFLGYLMFSFSLLA